MSPKSAAKKATPSKAAPKSAPSKSAAGKSIKEAATKSKKAELVAAPAAVAPEVDAEELEEQQDAASYQASNSSGEAVAATTTGAETSLSFKNFRHHPEMENFYRFIYENDLRYEALAVIDVILGEKRNLRKVMKEKSQAH